MFNLLGSLAQTGRSIIKERMYAALLSARKRGVVGGRPPAISDEKFEQICKAIDQGMSKAEAVRVFEVKRTTLFDYLSRRRKLQTLPQ